MARRWKEYEIEKMLDYRDQGLTEAKIAAKLTLIFMRPFTDRSVNRKIRDLKKIGYIDSNKHGGRFVNAQGIKRQGETHDEKASRSKKTARKGFRQPLR